MARHNDTLIIGGYQFSKLHNRKKGVLVTSIDPEDTRTSVVVSSKERSSMNESSHGQREGKREDLEAKALRFCRIVNKILQKQNSSAFVGYEVIYRMVSCGLSKNRAEALALGKELSKKLRLFYRVEVKRNTFSDDGKLYKFRPDVLLSVITKSPMCIQGVMPVDRRQTQKNDVSRSPTKFRRHVPKLNGSEADEEELIPKDNFIGTPMKRGRRPRGLHMIPQDESPSSQENWKEPSNVKQRATMSSIHESEHYNEDEAQSIYTEITISEHKMDFPPVPSMPLKEEEEASYMDFTVSTRSSSRDTQSYFDDFTVEDEDEYDTLSVPTTPVVCQKLSTRSLFSPSDAAGFDKCETTESEEQSAKPDKLSLSTRIRTGNLDIEIPLNDDGSFIQEGI